MSEGYEVPTELPGSTGLQVILMIFVSKVGNQMFPCFSARLRLDGDLQPPLLSVISTMATMATMATMGTFVAFLPHSGVEQIRMLVLVTKIY